MGSTFNLVTNPTGVTFTSMDDAIAKVDASGTVTGVKDGKTTIEIEMSGYNTLSIPVEIVKVPVPVVPVLTVDPTSVTVSTGDAIEFEVKADNVVVPIGDVTLSTDDSSIVLITPQTNEMLAGNVGTATVTVEYQNAVPVIVDVEVV